MKITILPHPKEIIDVDPQVIADFKERLADESERSPEQKQADEDQDYLER